MRRNVERIGIEPATGVHYSEPPVLSEKEINTLSEGIETLYTNILMAGSYSGIYMYYIFML